MNPQHRKRGRRSARRTSRRAKWLADLLRHGLFLPSFIPPQPIRALRELTRYRQTLGEAHAREVNRGEMLLAGANIKLASVAPDG